MCDPFGPHIFCLPQFDCPVAHYNFPFQLLRMTVKLASGAVLHSACPVWLSSGPLEFFTFSYCAWPWNWLICFVLFLLWRIVKWTRTSSPRPFSMEFEREPGGPLSPWQLLGKSCCCCCCRLLLLLLLFFVLFCFLPNLYFVQRRPCWREISPTASLGLLFFVHIYLSSFEYRTLLLKVY